MTDFITSHGITLKAYRCTICGGLDTDPDMLAKHEGMHQFMRKWMTGEASMAYLGKTRTKKKTQNCRSPHCHQPAKVHGYCSKHYMQHWSAGDFS